MNIYFFEKIAKIIHQYRLYKYYLMGYSNISKNVIIEKNVKLDKINKTGIIIGEYTLVAANCVILSHSHVKRDIGNPKLPLCVNTKIGKNCFIGIASIILPGVNIGDNVIIGEGSIVVDDIPSNCFAAGNPCKVKRENIIVDKYGIIK